MEDLVIMVEPTRVPEHASRGEEYAPVLSLVMPCYNEEDVIGYTIPQLTLAFHNAGIPFELVAVDNGSTDGTADILRELAGRDASVVVRTVQTNVGYGNGVLEGFKSCRGAWVGTIPADLQVDARSVVKLATMAAASSSPLLFKIRRRFRLESLSRRTVSSFYNAVMRLLFGNLGTMDINGNPKIFPRAYLEHMHLCSTDWFVDPEIMVKAKLFGMGVVEFNAFSQVRFVGQSAVTPATCWEFVKNILSHRFGKKKARLVSPGEDIEAAAREWTLEVAARKTATR